MVSGATSNCYQAMSHQHQQGLQIYSPMKADHDRQDPRDHQVSSSSFSFEPNASSSPSDHQSQSSTSLLYSLSILNEKVQQAKSLVTILISPSDHHQSHHQQQQPHPAESNTLAAIASMTNVIQEIIVTASSMIFTCQQMAPVDHGLPLAPDPNRFSISQQDVENIPHTERGQQQEEAAAFYPCTTHHHQTLDWFSEENYNDCTTRSKSTTTINPSSSNNRVQNLEENKELPRSYNGLQSISPPNNNKCDIIELEAAELLAKYTHYCQVCGKGFKRDANLRMHMRAHGDEYKSSVALSNPMKHNISTSASHNSEWSTKLVPRKYSCPEQGCRWNQKHAKFQPLKSMICVKNHYKRSHCPKMYVCKRCNQKQFSVLSDLRTHEKHCGDLRWQCSCGTTFSRKDKLMGHVTLFNGHAAVDINCLKIRAGKAETQA